MQIFDNFLNRFGLYTSRQQMRQYFNSKTQIIGTKGAVYIDTNVPKDLYEKIPELRLAVDKKAIMFSNMEMLYKNNKTGEVTKLPEDLAKLLQNPNMFQSFNEFLFNYSTQLDVYGNQYQYKVKTSKLTKYPNALFNISPSNLKPILTGKFYKQVDMSGVISYFELDENGKLEKIETNDILWSRISDLDNPLIGTSPLKSLKYPLSNVKLAYDYLNSISGNKGAIGTLSGEQKDTGGSLPLSPKQKEDLSKQYTATYGVEENQNSILISDVNVKFTPFSYPTKDLLLLEQIDLYFKRILEVLGLNPNLFINSTYENLRHGIQLTYNDTIIPLADNYCQSLTKFLGVEKGYSIVPSYAHISILQSDEKSEADTLKTKIDSIVQLKNANIITPIQANELLNQITTLELQRVDNTTSEKINLFSPLVATKVLENMTPNERRGLAGLTGLEGGDVLPTPAPSFGGGF
jgi:phage portal protein BeeE